MRQSPETIFTGEIGIAGHPLNRGQPPGKWHFALAGSKRYFETLGIGGMTTRGFGRLKVSIGAVIMLTRNIDADINGYSSEMWMA